MMSDQDRSILDQFTSRVRERFQEARIWAFGSRARGNATWESDFDICIVLDQVNQETDRWIRDIAWEVGFENERVITTVVFDFDQFENGPMSESTLVANVLQEGVAS
ncbi:MAG: nucleotidyltransferase domain-containing protein [Deltaproteobacteria bacterium]|nr:nucleotidyltransferase domain-containing protein [Deltaproteobacteria bacterium]